MKEGRQCGTPGARTQQAIDVNCSWYFCCWGEEWWDRGTVGLIVVQSAGPLTLGVGNDDCVIV